MLAPTLTEPRTDPPTVEVRRGLVAIDGLHPYDFVMTADCAEVTGRRLIAAAIEAKAAAAAGEAATDQP